MPVTLDSASGSWVNVVEVSVPTFVGDVIYYAVTIYAANELGVTEWPAMIIPGRGQWAEALRYGVMVGGLISFRHFVEKFGLDTNVMHWLPRMW